MSKINLKHLPNQPGIYVMKDKAGEVLYVGKAKNIKKRVASYFNKTQKSIKTVKLVEKISKIEPMVVGTETEALILENELIKEYRPPFNVIMRDDKNYLYIKISLQDEFPKIQLVRKVLSDGAKYFGPYVKSRAVHETLKLINKIFPLCSGKPNGGRACMNYHMGICPGVCVGEIDGQEYKQTINQVVDFLSGRYDEALNSMRQKMSHWSEAKKYEKAAKIRDAIRAVKSIGEKQRVITTNLKTSQDVVGLVCELNKAVVSLMKIRHGKLLHSEQYVMESKYESEDAEVVEGFLRDYYSNTQDFPKEVLVSVNVSEPEFFNRWLTKQAGHATSSASGRAGYKVEVINSSRGRKKQLVDLANRNAKVRFQELASRWRLENKGNADGVEKLRKLLKLKHLNRIEAYDISNTGGTDSVGSMVVFQKGAMDKKQYRRFKIKTVEGPNDFASLGEILDRRFKYKAGDKPDDSSHSQTGKKFASMPDLILIDGGKGQVSAVKNASKGTKVKIIGMVKGDHSAPKAKDDLVIDNKVVILPNHSPVKYLLQNIRDEAHRFAYAYHTHLRRKQVISSVLEKISGIGPVTRKKLIKKFGSMAGVKKASVKEIAEVVGEKKARVVKNQL